MKRAADLASSDFPLLRKTEVPPEGWAIAEAFLRLPMLARTPRCLRIPANAITIVDRSAGALRPQNGHYNCRYSRFVTLSWLFVPGSFLCSHSGASG